MAVVYNRFTRRYKVDGLTEDFTTREEAVAAIKRQKIAQRWGEKQKAGGTVSVVLTDEQYDWITKKAQSKCVRLSTLLREIVGEAMKNDG